MLKNITKGWEQSIQENFTGRKRMDHYMGGMDHYMGGMERYPGDNYGYMSGPGFGYKMDNFPQVHRPSRRGKGGHPDHHGGHHSYPAGPHGDYYPSTHFAPPLGYNTQQTTIINQPGHRSEIPERMPQNIREWDTNLFGCFDDLGICVYGWFCGWCQACSVAGQLNENICVVCCAGGAMSLRTKYRTMHGIKGDICGDCLAASFCGSLVICQLARELKNRPY